MKVYAVVGAGRDADYYFPVSIFLGIYRTYGEAAAVLKREWERVDKCIEDGEELDPERRREVDEEWSKLELPITMADEDRYEIFECEVPDGTKIPTEN